MSAPSAVTDRWGIDSGYEDALGSWRATPPDTRRALLELMGHRVDGARDGVSGVQIALASRPDVAFVDLGLPGMDGYEVARRLRAEGQRPYLIALTGYGAREDRDRALEAGFDAHVTAGRHRVPA